MAEFNLTTQYFNVTSTRGAILASVPRFSTGLVRDDVNVGAAVTDDEVIATALRILTQRMTVGAAMSNPRMIRDYLALRFAGLEHEIFACLFLDARHRVLACEELFRGTIDGAAVYPREVVKRALVFNAAAVIFAHNHPSGIAEPSQADMQITRRLKDALALVDIAVLDHLVVGADTAVSFAERGLL